MNELWFSREDCEKGLHLEYIKTLAEISSKLTNGYLEILLTGNGESTCVQYIKRYYADRGEDGHFEYVDTDRDEVVLKKVTFPDGHYDYFDKDVDVQKVIRDWEDDEET